jgi:hypothetical protein
MGWAWWAAVPILLAFAVLISDAIYQIVRERPSFLPFERALYKRMPATGTDCLLQGAARLLIGVGLLILQAPWLVVGAMGGLQDGGLLAEHALGATGMACAAIALLLLASAAVIESRVHFTRLTSTSRSPDLPA